MKKIKKYSIPVNLMDLLNNFCLYERIRGLVSLMSARESKILSLRFGLKDGIKHSLRDTGEHFGITRERVRQIQEIAIRKLKEYMIEEEQGENAGHKQVDSSDQST